MKRPAPAYLRKNLDLLKIASSHGNAKIQWRSMDLGSWEDLRPRWQVVGGRIRFRSRCNKALTFWVSKVKPTPWGVSILFSASGHPVPEAMEVKWMESPSESSSQFFPVWDLSRLWLEQNFSGSEIVWAGKRPDLARSLSGRFLRVIFRHRKRQLFLIVAPPDCAGEAHLALGQALLWLCSMAGRKSADTADAFHFLVPIGSSSVLNHRCQFLNKKLIDGKVWEYEEREELQIHRVSSAPVPAENKDFRWPATGPFRWSAQLERVLNMAPDLTVSRLRLPSALWA